MTATPGTPAGPLAFHAPAARGARPEPATREALAWSERVLLDNVVAFARRNQWMAVHFGGDLHGKAWFDAAGFPDLVLIHADPALVWFRELKTARGRLTPAQQRWQELLADAGCNVDVWRPADWPDIVQALSFGRARVQ